MQGYADIPSPTLQSNPNSILRVHVQRPAAFQLPMSVNNDLPAKQQLQSCEGSIPCLMMSLVGALLPLQQVE